jgi:WD40 repeat protein
MDGEDADQPLIRKLDSLTLSTPCKSRIDEIMRGFRNWNPFSNAEYSGHGGAVWACAITSDNLNLFSGCEDSNISIWSTTSRELLGTLPDHTKCVNCLALTSDDSLLISGGWDNLILVWDWRNRRLQQRLDGHTGGVYAFYKSPNEKLLASGAGDYSVKVWNLESLTLVTTLSCSNNTPFGVAINKDNSEVVAGCFDSKLRFFNIQSSSSISEYDTKSGAIQSLSLTSDDKYIVFGTRNNLVKVWNYKDKTEYCSFSSHLNWVRNVVTIPDSKLFITVSADKRIKIFDIETKSEQLTLEGSEGYVFGEALSKDGKYLLTGASDKVMRLWNIGTKVRSNVLLGHSKCIVALAISSDNKWIVTGSLDTTAKVWSLEEKLQVASLEGHTDSIWAVAITEDIKYIVTVSADKKVILWNFETKNQEFVFEGHQNPIFSVASSYDSKIILSGGQDKDIIAWDIEKKSLVKTLIGHTDTVFTIKLTPDDKYIVSGSADFTVKIWDRENYILRYKLEFKEGMIESVSLSKDGKFLVVGDRANLVHLYDFANKKLIKTFRTHTAWVKSVSFANNSNLFASVSNDYSVRLWSAEEERHEFLITGHANTIRAVAFTKDDKYVVSAGEDLTVRIWNVSDIKDNELADIGSSIDTYLFLANIKKEADPSINNYKKVFSSLKINIAHFYCYLGYDSLLRKALDLGTDIRIDSDGRSPLYYALERGSQGCVDVILEYLVELKNKDFSLFLNYTRALRDDILALISNRSMHLPDFIDAIYYKIPDVTNFAVPKKQLPILQFTELRELDPYLFVYKPKDTPDTLQELPIMFKTLPFAIPFIKGSQDSIDFLNAISECPNSKILQSEFIVNYVRNKWNDLWIFILLQTVLIWTNLLLMIAILIIASPVGKYNDNDDLLGYEYSPLDLKWVPLVGGFLGVNTILILYEFIQAFSSGPSYFIEFWNIIDLLRNILCFSWAILSFSENQQDLLYLTWFMVILNFFRGLSGFKAFDTTRFYTRLIFRSFFDSISFIMIFFYSTFAFGAIYYASLGLKKATLFNLWQSPYNLNMGNFDGDNDNGLVFAYYMMATIINIIIMLNLLISILGDSFESFQSESKEIDCLEMIGLVIELETIIFWRRHMNTKAYIQKCDHLEFEGSEGWEGRVLTLSTAIKKLRIDSKENFNLLFKKIDDLSKRIK